ncbi:hypothetical protein [Rugamonas sp. DEMB1]|uniref:hypothetical protein n=1 Tax=Rugamonas sp. DEMB1 TaxID=3039386 RepID=UPI00244ACF26|nr:hypothetical protein [Rugamonas sp. DEMB1]WGG52406.1 hypothetical protein QC826_09785 [Rugamonas sp. DEMB1]
MMPILELRILPPLAVARLGGAAEPLEAFDLETDPDSPMNYRRIVPRESFEVDQLSGRIVRAYVPDNIRFKDENKLVRPVAPFLEVYARTSEEPGQLQPLTAALLAEHGLALANLHWDVELGNIKIYRRTNNRNDQIHANLFGLQDHARHALNGWCENFKQGKTLPLGHVQFIAPTDDFPEIRLRYTPAAGLVYGSRMQRLEPQADGVPLLVPDPIIDSD